MTAPVSAPTAGPWEVHTLNGRLPVVREVKMPHGEASTFTATIRAIDGTHVCKLDFGYGRKGVDEANARLIASASELLDALDRLAGEVAGCWGMAESELRAALGNTNYAVVAERVAAAVAAIAKAEGR